MDGHEEYFNFIYNEASVTIRKAGADTYVFGAVFGMGAGTGSFRGEPVICGRETLEKAISLAKDVINGSVIAQMEFGPFCEEWQYAMRYPYAALQYSSGGETFFLHGDTEEDLAKITVTSPAFIPVMTLIHKLAVLFRDEQEAARQKTPVPETNRERSLQKVLCPFCGKPIRRKSNFCAMCGKSLLDIKEFAPSDEKVDPNETLWTCRTCGGFVSWTDVFCRHCGATLHD